MTRRMVGRFLVALSAAVVVGAAFVLTVAAVASVPWDAQSALMAALGSVFLSQSLVVSVVLTARRPAGGTR